jgi:hypothetical protein
MSKKQVDRSGRPVPPRPVAPARPSDADRLSQGLPLESGEVQPRPAPRRMH